MRLVGGFATSIGGRLEWWCLDWNQPSIAFYQSMGAEPMKDWTVYRISGDALEKLSEK